MRVNILKGRKHGNEAITHAARRVKGRKTIDHGEAVPRLRQVGMQYAIYTGKKIALPDVTTIHVCNLRFSSPAFNCAYEGGRTTSAGLP